MLKFVPGQIIEVDLSPRGFVAAPKLISNGCTGNKPRPLSRSAVGFPSLRRTCKVGQVESGKEQVVLMGSICAANAGSLRADLHSRVEV